MVFGVSPFPFSSRSVSSRAMFSAAVMGGVSKSRQIFIVELPLCYSLLSRFEIIFRVIKKNRTTAYSGESPQNKLKKSARFVTSKGYLVPIKKLINGHLQFPDQK
jgi:hypothetical protein